MIGGAAGVATCRGCGCTDLRACPGGCWWGEVDYLDGGGVCSRCVRRIRRRR